MHQPATKLTRRWWWIGALFGVAVVSTYLLFHLNIALPDGTGQQQTSSPLQPKLKTPPATQPRFSRGVIKSSRQQQHNNTSLDPTVQSLLGMGWEEQDVNNITTRSQIVLLDSLDKLTWVRANNAKAFVNVLNSPCLWGGAKQQQLACFEHFAANTRCAADFFLAANFGTKDEGEEEEEEKRVTVLVRSVHPWSAYIVATSPSSSSSLSRSARQVTQFALQAIQFSLKRDVYRSQNMFQVFTLVMRGGGASTDDDDDQDDDDEGGFRLHSVEPNPVLPVSTWTAILSTSSSASSGDEAADEQEEELRPLAMEERMRCRLPRLPPTPPTSSSSSSCASAGGVHVASALPCSTLERTSRVKWWASSLPKKDKCVLGKTTSLAERRNYGTHTGLGGSEGRDLQRCSSSNAVVTSSWREAHNFCQAAGARLCSLQEVVSGVAPASTGCSLEYQRTWTATRCSNHPLSFWMAIPAKQERQTAPPPPICFPYSADSIKSPPRFFKPVTARCCADEPQQPPSLTTTTCVAPHDARVFTPGDPFLPCLNRTTTTVSALSCSELYFKWPSSSGKKGGRKKASGGVAQFCGQRNACAKRTYATFCEAKAYCHAAGARLCTRAEYAQLPPDQSAAAGAASSKCEVWTAEDDTDATGRCATFGKKRRYCCGDRVGRYCDLLNV